MATLFVDNLTVLDFSRLDAERGMVGESWIVDIELSGDLDDHNMVFDFGHVKRIIKQELDRAVDHCLLVPTETKQLQVNADAERVQLEWHYQQGCIRLDAPLQSVFLLAASSVNRDDVTNALIKRIKAVLPANVKAVVLRLRDEVLGDNPCYHYSHGLKHHDGNCQRIAHGHRSRITIEENGRRNKQRESAWAERWRDIYLGSQSDLQTTLELDGVEHYNFCYHANQGYFELTIPAQACYLFNTDTTVELIAAHLAAQLAREEPGSEFRVHAYEGVGKGAIA